MSWSRGANSLLRKAGRRRPGRSSGGSGDSYEDSDEDSFFAANSDDELVSDDCVCACVCVCARIVCCCCCRSIGHWDVGCCVQDCAGGHCK